LAGIDSSSILQAVFAFVKKWPKASLTPSTLLQT
jgi:hypothetical protein